MINTMEKKQLEPKFVVCLKNEGYSASLEPRKIYRNLPDSEAAAHSLIRVIDESGEDYLYPAGYFAAITLPKNLVDALAMSAC
jgi:hypothetical protein